MATPTRFGLSTSFFRLTPLLLGPSSLSFSLCRFGVLPAFSCRLGLGLSSLARRRPRTRTRLLWPRRVCVDQLHA
jgi:hypothetical protein